jgi:hypothetical protein
MTKFKRFGLAVVLSAFAFMIYAATSSAWATPPDPCIHFYDDEDFGQ